MSVRERLNVLVREQAYRQRLREENIMMCKSNQLRSKELEYGYKNIPARAGAHLGTCRFSMFSPYASYVPLRLRQQAAWEPPYLCNRSLLAPFHCTDCKLFGQSQPEKKRLTD